MLADDLVAESETEAGARMVAGAAGEATKQVGPISHLEPWTLVGDDETHPTVVLENLYRDPPPGASMAERIVDEIDQRAFE